MARPKKQFDLSALKQLCAMMSTNEEIARFFGCSERTIIRASQNDQEVEKAMQQGRAMGRISLRRAQMRAAEQGNATMLIWLGKQYLGQREPKDVIITAEMLDAEIKRMEAALQI